MAIMVPIYTYWEIPYFWIAMKMYDWVAGSQRGPMPPSHYINSDEALYRLPSLKKEGLKGALVYYDGQHDDARMNLAIALSARERGAHVLNHTEVTDFIFEDPQSDAETGVRRIIGATLTNRLSGEKTDVFARTIINATGPFTDSVP